MARFLASRLQRLEAKRTPQFRPMATAALDPATGKLTGPKPDRPFLPGNPFPTVEAWEQYVAGYRDKLFTAQTRAPEQGT